MSALDELLDALPRLALVVGKGGVGKTTCAAALALHSARRGERTLVLSTDPAATLGEALGTPLDATLHAVEGAPHLHATQLDPGVARRAFLERWRDVIVRIIDRGTYLDLDDITPLVDAALPGADEVFALLRLAEIIRDATFERIIVDTAPTGHTLRLLALPRTFEALVALLDTMQEKHRFMVRALTHRYRADDADAFIAAIREEVRGLRAALAEPARAAAAAVARAEPVVVAESKRLARELGELGVELRAIVINAVPETLDPEGRASLGALLRLAGSPGVAPRGGSGAAAVARCFVIPRLVEPPDGRVGLARWGAAMRAARGAAPPGGPPPEGTITSAGSNAATIPTRATPRRRAERAAARAGGAPPDYKLPSERAATIAESPRLASSQRSALSAPPSLAPRALTVVGGKGGVGKTTVACALALGAADSNIPTLVVSTDPAPSVADVLGVPVGDADTTVAEHGPLAARQMDAAAAFARLRDEYRAHIDDIFDAFVARGVDAAHDRAVLRDLLALAPPGIDEVYALGELGETLDARSYECVVVDPAPTGHLLRLLEMPALAIEWSHQLMRLMLKYKEVGALGALGEDVLAFARRTRALDRLWRDASRAGVIVVALDEPLVRGETRRLVDAIRARGFDVMAVLWNRVAADATRPPSALDTDPPVPQLLAPAVEPHPVGAEALRAWMRSWRALSPAPAHA